MYIYICVCVYTCKMKNIFKRYNIWMLFNDELITLFCVFSVCSSSGEICLCNALLQTSLNSK